MIDSQFLLSSHIQRPLVELLSTNLSVVARSRLMSVHAPLHISRPRPFKKEGYKVSGVSTAGPVATKVTWHSRGRVEIRSQL